MKRALVLGVLAVASIAWPAAAGKGPVYGEIPASQMGARPPTWTKPKTVAARETLPGIKAKSVAKQVVLAFDTTTGKPAMKVSEVGGCVTSGYGTGDTEWDGPLDAEAHIKPTAGIVPIHAEKLVDAADGTTKLETTDAWLDTRTRGLRVIAKSTLALKPYSTIPGGTRILVARDERAGKRFVQFVIAEAKNMPAYLLERSMNRITRVSTETRLQALGICSHHRIGIPATGAGESASLELKAVLPPLAAGEKSAAMTDLAELSEQEKKMGVSDVRTRGVRVHVGVSQTSRDKDPVIAVSSEWVGEESIERIYTDREATFRAQNVFSLDSFGENEPTMTDDLF